MHASALTAGRLAGLLAAVLLALPAAAQWAWRDDNGRVVYSDRPPPAAVKSEQIVRQPGSRPTPPPALGTEAPADASKGAASAPKTLAEREMEFRKRQDERAASAKKAADEEAQKQRLAQDCERMRGYLRQLDEGVRIARTDAQGNREILEDAQRAAESQRARDDIARNCN